MQYVVYTEATAYRLLCSETLVPLGLHHGPAGELIESTPRTCTWWGGATLPLMNPVLFSVSAFVIYIR